MFNVNLISYLEKNPYDPAFPVMRINTFMALPYEHIARLGNVLQSWIQVKNQNDELFKNIVCNHIMTA